MVYIPGKLPQLESDDAKALAYYLEGELKALARSMVDFIAVELRVSYRVPDKPRAGMLVYADGVQWNPGAGEGVYVYSVAGSWNKL